MTAEVAFFPLAGGLDLVTPAVSLKPGSAIAALNYEPTATGYRRLRGYERFDGQTAPSEAQARLITYDGAILQFLAGQELYDMTADAVIGHVLANATLVSGAFGATGVAQVLVLLTHLEFALDNEQYSGNGGANSYGQQVGDDVVDSSAASTALAVAKARSLITVVPGSGPVRGVWKTGSTVIAVRDNAGATAGAVYRAGIGWVETATAKTFTFNSGGVGELPLRNLVAGATSGATGEITAITLTSGSWAAGTAAGSITILTTTGTFQDAENLDATGGNGLAQANILTLTNAGTSYALPAGGTYEFINHNFYGASNLARPYGVNGVGPAFIYDVPSQTLVPISTGMTVDTPNHLAAHRGSLFLSFPGGSLQFSALGEPLNFDPLIGAGELGVGSDITALVPTAGALAVLAENSINVLYGNDASDYLLETLTNEAGALPHTAQKIGNILYMDNRGLRSLATSQAFGNFAAGTLTKLIEPLLQDYRKDGVEPVACLTARSSDQYWVFFSNGTGLIVYLGAKQPAILPFNLGKTVTCAASVEDEGEERLFIGCSDGFVYELNKGTSFDGEEIEHYVRLPFNHFGSPQRYKRFFKASVDVEATGTTTLEASFDLNHGSIDGIPAQTLNITTGGGAIDGLGTNELYYASQIETQAEIHIQGLGKNISMKIGGSSATEQPHTLTGVSYHVLPRGQQR